MSKIITGVDLASAQNSTAILCLSCYRVDCAHIDGIRRALERGERPSLALVIQEADPPSYLPTREPLPPRIPDLCPDDAKDEPHNPETCTNPTCDCYPF